MSSPYDVSTVVSRSYIPEQLQDNMQKGQEQKNVAFLAEFQREFEKKQKEVSGTIKTESTGVADKSIKMEEERKKREKRRKQKQQQNKKEKHSGIDIQA
ncbi:MAG: hypothetical protein ROM03_07995 [Mucispirillum sp.]|nr:hypothetical protein [Mucispirillum sp.]